MPTIRLYISDSLFTDQYLLLSQGQSHYINHVMRQQVGDSIALFNGQDGLWHSTVHSITRKETILHVKYLLEPQSTGPDIWLCFAPVKNAPLQTLIQKATELGVSALCPVQTKHTVVHHLHSARITSHCIEAAEQCRRLTIPTLYPLRPLPELLENWDTKRTLILCDESGHGSPIAPTLSLLPKAAPLAILIGPEGGFSALEFEILRKQPYIKSVGMGPRILRSDTAAISALACCMSILGDWQTMPAY